MGVLNDPPLEALLAELHARSDAQLPDIERYVKAARRQASPTKEADFRRYRSDKLLAIDRHKGEFCYQMCRAVGVWRVVEVGTSYGVSAMYFAAAMRDNGGGIVIGTEHEPAKVGFALESFERAGLASFIDLREGDFRETLLSLNMPVDLLLIDAWAGAAKPALELALPRLRQGAVVLCDDILACPQPDYLELLASSGFRTTTLPFQDGLALSVRCG